MIIKKLFYLVIVILILQVVKIASIKLNLANSYLIGIIVIYLQTLSVFFPIVYYLISRLFRKARNASVKRVVVVTISIAIIGCLEAITLYGLNHPERIPASFHRPYFYYYEKYDFKIIQFDAEKAVYDTELFYKLRPNTRFVFSNREFQDSFYVNSMGLRDTERSLSAPEIICLGDSYFMGWGVHQESTFAKLLEKKLSARVLNAAVSSYGTARELALLKKLDTSRCKAIVIQYCANDWYENRSYIANNYRLAISPLSLYESRLKEEKQKQFYLPGLHFALISQLFLKHAVNDIRPVFNLRLDRDEKVSDDRKQAEDFLTILIHHMNDFGPAHVYITLMESFGRINNGIIEEMQTLINEPRFVALSGRVSFITTRNLFKKEDYYFLDLHTKSTAYEKLSTLMSDSILSRQTVIK